MLSAPLSPLETLLGLVGAAATKSLIIGGLILSLFNPVVYLISGFRWTFFGQGDVSVIVSLGAVAAFLTVCLVLTFWMLRSGYRRLKH